MHAAEREHLIMQMLQDRGFIGFQELDKRVDASPATLRRDLERLAEAGRITRVRGGARLVGGISESAHLSGVPFHENIGRHKHEKEAIGRAAAKLCRPAESVIIDGGSTTLQMCAHVADLGLQVLTNSLHIVSALLPQPNTRISIPGGTVFREQNIVLSAFEEDGAPSRYRASKMFLGAAAVGHHGLMQTDTLLVQAERRLLSIADKVVLMVDSSKFSAPAGHILCPLESVSIVVTDDALPDACAAYIEAAGAELIIAPR